MSAVSADLHPGTRSRPLYRDLVPDPQARSHLVVVGSGGLADPLLDRFAGRAVDWLAGPGALAALPARLAGATTGLRLYAVGEEAFLWDAARVAQSAGLGLDEIHLYAPEQTRRRVRCLHCRTVTDDVAGRDLDCPGCGLRLLVRDHFSRRFGAFQGVATHGATRGEGG